VANASNGLRAGPKLQDESLNNSHNRPKRSFAAWRTRAMDCEPDPSIRMTYTSVFNYDRSEASKPRTRARDCEPDPSVRMTYTSVFNYDRSDASKPRTRAMDCEPDPSVRMTYTSVFNYDRSDASKPRTRAMDCEPDPSVRLGFVFNLAKRGVKPRLQDESLINSLDRPIRHIDQTPPFYFELVFSIPDHIVPNQRR
jgi:hypothetical protein